MKIESRVKSLEEFLRLIDKAIESASITLADVSAANAPDTVLEAAKRTVENLKELQENVRAGKIPRPSKDAMPPGATLGLARHIGDWTDDERLLAAVRAVDRFYRDHY